MRNFKDIIDIARKLRREQTPSEALLWQELRNKKLNGIKFYRQHPLIHGFENRYLFYIADFYSRELSLVVELDGKIHEDQKEQDASRDAILSAKGLNTLRIKNEELRDIKMVLKRILQFV